MNLLNPKNIILNAVKSKLVGTGIVKITMVFNIIDDKYTILMTDEKGEKTKSPLVENEISMIKKMFISKIQKKFESTSEEKIKSVVIQIDFNEANDDVKVNVYIEDIKEKVTKLDF
jgi:hypothetical protein